MGQVALSNVIGFFGAKRRAFVRELRRINAEFRGRNDRIRNLANYWGFEDDPAYARACAQAEITLLAIIDRLEKCLAAAKKYGADPAPFERALKRWQPDEVA